METFNLNLTGKEIEERLTDATTEKSGLMSTSNVSKLNGIQDGAEVNVQSDWNQIDETKADFIKNKPFGNKTTITETKTIGIDPEVSEPYPYYLPLSATNIQISTNGLSNWSVNETRYYYKITSESSITIEKLPSDVITLFTFDGYRCEHYGDHYEEDEEGNPIEVKDEFTGSVSIVLYPNGLIAPEDPENGGYGQFDISYEKFDTLDAKYIPIDNKTIIDNGDGTLGVALKYELLKEGNQIALFCNNGTYSVITDSDTQSDWNQNNQSGSDYIKNRTHYEYEGDIIKDKEITTAGYSQVLPRALKPDTTYTITIDGDKHELKTPSEAAPLAEQLLYVKTYSKDSKYSVEVKVDKNEIKITPNKTITFSLHGLMIQQLNEKYLPIALHAGLGEASLVQNDGSEWVLDDGSSNWTNATHAVIFGNNNRVYETVIDASNGYINGKNSFIGGGLSNDIHSANSTIIGGRDNIIGTSNVFKGFSAIAGGHSNSVYGNYDFTGGGRSNTIDADSSFASITGGQSHNILGGSHSAIVGGYNSDLSNVKSFIGGGEGHTLSSEKSAIVGGENNKVSGKYGVIDGGHDNELSGEASVIAGGYNNIITGPYSIIAGGYQNNISGESSVIAGGRDNTAQGLGVFNAGIRNFINAQIGTTIGVDNKVGDETTKPERVFAIGDGLKSNSGYQFLLGKWNAEDPDACLIVGAGLKSNSYKKDYTKETNAQGGTIYTQRQNIHTLSKTGDAWYAGKITAGADPVDDMDVATKKYVDDNRGVDEDWVRTFISEAICNGVWG